MKEPVCMYECENGCAYGRWGLNMQLCGIINTVKSIGEVPYGKSGIRAVIEKLYSLDERMEAIGAMNGNEQTIKVVDGVKGALAYFRNSRLKQLVAETGVNSGQRRSSDISTKKDFRAMKDYIENEALSALERLQDEADEADGFVPMLVVS